MPFVASRQGRSWLAVALLAAGLAVVVSSGGAQAAPKEIAIEQFAFAPAAVTVAAGDTVQWTNNDTAPHTVTITSGPTKFSSPTLQKGDTFSFTFDEPGTYSYYCAIHPDMKAAVTVSPGPATVPTESPPAGHAMPPPSVPTAPVEPVPAPPTTAPAPTAAPAPAPAVDVPSAPDGTECEGDAVAGAMLEPFVVHLNKAHLEQPPGQQAADLLDLDQYVKTHTVLVEQMYMPAVAVAMAAPKGVAPFVTHVNEAHLEESPGQQAGDLLDVEQYVKTHTVLVGDMAAPTTKSATGTPGC